MYKMKTDNIGLVTSGKMSREDKKEFRENLLEDTAYLVSVSYNEFNPVHEAIFFMGFHNGNYCEIYNNSYDGPKYLDEVYSIKIIKKLYTFKN